MLNIMKYEEVAPDDNDNDDDNSDDNDNDSDLDRILSQAIPMDARNRPVPMICLTT